MKYKTKHIGIGGIKCPCCVRGTPSQVKRLVNREQRRKAKKDIKNNVDN
jgi:hypothetical protein